MKLNTREWGTGDRLALLVHGIMSDHRSWRSVGPALAGRGYRVIAVDLRGHGASPRGEGAAPVDRYGPEHYARTWWTPCRRARTSRSATPSAP